MKLYLKLLMFTLMISDARIIVNEIMRESAAKVQKVQKVLWSMLERVLNSFDFLIYPSRSHKA